MEYEREPRISTETDLTPKHRKLKETSKKTQKTPINIFKELFKRYFSHKTKIGTIREQEISLGN